MGRIVRLIGKEAGWTAAPPLVVALVLGLFTSPMNDPAAASHSEPVATGEDCSGAVCVPISHGEWQLQHVAMLQTKMWMPVVLIAYFSVGCAIVRWLTRLYRRVSRQRVERVP